MKKIQKGFTLIELLVVIAIIGLLASIVLVSVGGARDKGSDAVVKADVSGIRTNAELQFSNLGCYAVNGTTCSSSVPAVVETTTGNKGTSCPTTGSSIFVVPGIAKQISAADSANGSNFVSCGATVGGTAWAVVAQYKSDILKGWCVDSTGKSQEVTITTGTAQANVDAEITSGACVEA